MTVEVEKYSSERDMDRIGKVDYTGYLQYISWNTFVYNNNDFKKYTCSE